MGDLGLAAEQWLAAELTLQGWQIVTSRWRCRWGELDIVVRSAELLVFVEVKARRRNGLDGDGLFALSPLKQQKLHHTAQLFIAAHPELSPLSCRFDVALVRILPEGFRLNRYIAGAFE